MKKKKSTKSAHKRSAAKVAIRRTTSPASKVALKGTVSKAKLRAELRHVPWHSVEVEALNPLLGRHFIVGQNIMLARVLPKEGSIVPEHSHPNEQLTFIAAGVLKCWTNGREIIVSADDVLTRPP